ncbi:MAG: hypothetical protein IPL83_16240 [Bdellovibrionales bacterium]|nr:hypothetical protein [Bdellovibrionales bacterium]
MNQIHELSTLINQTFNWNKARIDCLDWNAHCFTEYTQYEFNRISHRFSKRG